MKTGNALAHKYKKTERVHFQNARALIFTGLTGGVPPGWFYLCLFVMNWLSRAVSKSDKAGQFQFHAVH